MRNKRSPQVSVWGHRLRHGRAFLDLDDAAAVVGKFRNGAILNLEATRFADRGKNQLAFEINGSRGSLSFDL
jgi:predicted dehydrogenase